MNGATVAYQGEPGAFSEAAAIRLGCIRTTLLPCLGFADVFAALASGRAAFAVVPYVNSLAGPVEASCSLLAREGVKVLDEVVLQVSHALIAPPGVERAELKFVSSHPVALKQCAGLLRRNPRWCVRPADDTAGAVAEMMRRGARDHAAIASEHAAKLYGAAILEREVQDSKENRTSFLLVEKLR